MKKISIVLLGFLFLFLSLSASASTFILSEISEEYQLCVYKPEGTLLGCSTNSSNATGSATDLIFQLKYTDSDLINKPLNIFAYLGYSLIILVIIIAIALFYIGFSKSIGRIL